MEKRKRFEEAKRFIAPKVARRPKTQSLHELARKTASIRLNDLTRHKQHVERLALQEGIKKATIHNNLRMERDALLGSSMHGYLGAEAHNRLNELTRFLNAR